MLLVGLEPSSLADTSAPLCTFAVRHQGPGSLSTKPFPCPSSGRLGKDQHLGASLNFNLRAKLFVLTTCIFDFIDMCHILKTEGSTFFLGSLYLLPLSECFIFSSAESSSLATDFRTSVISRTLLLVDVPPSRSWLSHVILLADSVLRVLF